MSNLKIFQNMKLYMDKFDIYKNDFYKEAFQSLHIDVYKEILKNDVEIYQVLFYNIFKNIYNNDILPINKQDLEKLENMLSKINNFLVQIKGNDSLNRFFKNKDIQEMIDLFYDLKNKKNKNISDYFLIIYLFNSLYTYSESKKHLYTNFRNFDINKYLTFYKGQLFESLNLIKLKKESTINRININRWEKQSIYLDYLLNFFPLIIKEENKTKAKELIKGLLSIPPKYCSKEMINEFLFFNEKKTKIIKSFDLIDSNFNLYEVKNVKFFQDQKELKIKLGQNINFNKLVDLNNMSLKIKNILELKENQGNIYYLINIGYLNEILEIKLNIIDIIKLISNKKIKIDNNTHELVFDKTLIDLLYNHEHEKSKIIHKNNKTNEKRIEKLKQSRKTYIVN